MSFVHGFTGNLVATATAPAVNATNTTYTAYPPAKSCSIENAKSEVAIAGPTARASDAVVCASPLGVPSERLFGVDELMKMKRQSGIRWEEVSDILSVGHN